MVDVYDRLGKCLGRLLRQIVPDTSGDDPVRVLAGEFPGIGTGIRVRCAIRIAFESDSGHSDDRPFGKPLF